MQKKCYLYFSLRGKKKHVSEKLYIHVMFSFIFPNCGLPCIVQCLFWALEKSLEKQSYERDALLLKSLKINKYIHTYTRTTIVLTVINPGSEAYESGQA